MAGQVLLIEKEGSGKKLQEDWGELVELKGFHKADDLINYMEYESEALKLIVVDPEAVSDWDMPYLDLLDGIEKCSLVPKAFLYDSKTEVNEQQMQERGAVAAFSRDEDKDESVRKLLELLPEGMGGTDGDKSGQFVLESPDSENTDKDSEKKKQKRSFADGVPRILAVDDDPECLRLLKLYLEKDYKIVLVNSGKQAISFLKKNTVDLILLDVMMPVMDGIETLEKIRNNGKDKSTPVIFLTGAAERSVVMEATRFSPEAYVLKPVKETLLKERLNKVL